MKSTTLQYETTSTSTSGSTMTGTSHKALVKEMENTTKLPKTPKYYKGKYMGIEAFDVVMDFQEDSYNIGVAIAYLLRAGKKEGNPIAQELSKAIHHLQKELEYELNHRPTLTKDDKS
jgi:hypothetical protein